MLALDALSGRRLIAGTIPAFDRWTLAETPTEDARLHDVFVRALHPDPDQRYASLDAWLTALAGTERADDADALSRFAREGVILAAAVSAPEPGRDIKVQTIEDPEGVALSLFPEEDGTVESPVVETSALASVPAPVSENEAEAEAEQEWLVAEVPEQGPIGEPNPEPFVMRHAPPPIEAESPAAPGNEWRLDDGDRAAATPEPARTWDVNPDDSPGRGPWLVIAVLLVLAALGYGTWQSLQRPAATPAASVTPGGSGAEPTSTEAPSARQTPPPASRGSSDTSDATRRPPAQTPPRSVPQAPVTSARSQAPSASVVPPAGRSVPPPAAAASTNTGRVLIRSSPSAEVRVNGTSRGETPVVLRDLPFGQYVVSVTRPGFESVQREVTLVASQPVASLSIDLVRAGTVPPSGAAAGGTTGSVSGAQTGGAATGPSPAAGESTASAAPATSAPTTPGAAASRPASQPPETPSVTPPAAPTGGIFVVSTPSQARIFVDGQAYGNTPAGIPGLSQGAHTVRVEAPGYRPWEGRVAVIAGTRVRVQATLQQEQE
jgi:hypothetical protein